MKKHTLLLSALFSASLFAANAQALSYTASNVSYSDDNGYSGTTTVGNFSEQGRLGIASPGQITWDFTATADTGIFSFEIAGYRTLDGYNSIFEDDLAVYVNGTEVFAGSFNLLGSGLSVVSYNPGNAGFSVTHGNAALVDNVDAHGTLNVSNLALNLLNGNNTIQFVYSGLNQGMNDEGWGLNSANVVTNQVPEPEILTLLTLGLLVTATSRKKANSVYSLAGIKFPKL